MQLSVPLDSTRWDPASPRGHVESWFLKANDPSEPGRALWLKTTLLVPPKGAPGAEIAVWAIVFGPEGHRAAKTSWPIERAELSRDGLGATVGDCVLEPGRFRGALDGITWDVTFSSEDEPMFAFPGAWMYEGGFPKSKLYTSTPRSVLGGRVTVDDRDLPVDGWIGMLGHNWGLFHSPAYHWAQVNLLDEGAIFEGYSGRIPLGPVLSPWLSGGVLRWQGRTLRFNRLTGLPGNHVAVGPGRWSCRLQEDGWRLRWTVEAPQRDFVGLRYVDPDGRENHCLNTKIADCTLRLEERRGGSWREAAVLRGERCCAYEILTRRHDHGVPILA